MFDWVSSLGGLNPIVATIAVVMICVAIMTMKSGIPAIIEAAKKKEIRDPEKDLDLFQEMQALAKAQISQVRDELNAQNEMYERKLNRLEQRITCLEDALHTAQYKLRLATDHIAVQENYISLHLPERSDHPVRPTELRVQTISTTTMYHD